MAFCTPLWARWRGFIGALPPTHALLFQLLLLALLAANVVGIVMTGQRLQHSYQFPISVMNVKRLKAPPPFTVALAVPGSGNTSLSCVQYWDEVPCPSLSMAPLYPGDAAGLLFAGTSTSAPFSAGDATMFMVLFAHDMQAGDCWSGGLMGVPLASITRENVRGFMNAESPSATFRFCPKFAPGERFTQTVHLTFSALQDVHGKVSFTISTVTDGGGMDTQADKPPALILRMDFPGEGMPVSWETQEYSYTWMDFLGAIFANFNISLTIIAFLFPWRYVGAYLREERRFRLACVKGGDIPADESTDLESDASRSQQMQERMLPRDSDASHPMEADRAALYCDPEFERAVRRVLIDQRGTSPLDPSAEV